MGSHSHSNKTTTTTTTTPSLSASSSSSHSHSSLSPTNTQKTALSQIDSTLNSLNDTFPYSSEHRARPSSTVSASSSTKSDLARSLGAFSTNTHHSSLSNLYSPGLTNPLSHWNNVSALRNPYATYGAHRSAAKSVSNTKDINNPRKKTYEDKMDKQRLEHILFSGDNSGPLNQQKERMRQKLERKKSQKNVKKNKKKTQILPNGHTSANGLLGFEAARNQKANGDNRGYFLTDAKPQKN